MRGDGYHRLWGWFGLSRASFLTLPRILMHEMPDDWQGKMANLLAEYDATFDRQNFPECKVMAVRDDGKFASWPEWMLNYRRPCMGSIAAIRSKPCDECGKLDHECPCISAALDAVNSK